MTEHVDFEMHPALLWDVINRQSGTISKAILEGVQNAVDAGATRCDLTVDRESFSIKDDGRGFEREDIFNFFRTFGQPHEEGDAKFGRYRMGRGQIMSFGVNRWLTNGHRMDVDLKPQKASLGTRKLGFQLSALDERVRGCDILVALYDRLQPSDVDTLSQEIARYVAWTPIPVTLNGKLVSKDPASSGETWDLVTDDAYVRLRDKGPLAVYNMGVLVCEIPSYRLGTGGTVVSRKALDVTFARNEIVSSCKTWKRIQAGLREHKGEEVERKPKVTETERQGALADIAVGRADIAAVKDKALFELASGTKVTLNALGLRLKATKVVGCAPLKDRSACKVLDDKMAVVFSEDLLRDMHVETPRELLAKLHRQAQQSQDRHKSYVYYLDPGDKTFVTAAEMAAMAPDGMSDVATAKLNAAERFSFEVLKAGMWAVMSPFRDAGYIAEGGNGRYYFERLSELGITGELQDRLVEHMRAGGGGRTREIRVGASSTAQAWTDGRHKIWFERDQLRLVSKGTAGFHRLAMLGLHEMLTSESDMGTHVHDAAFHELFADLAATDVVGHAVERMINEAVKLVRKEERRPTGALRKTEDSLALLRDNGIGSRFDADAPAPHALAM